MLERGSALRRFSPPAFLSVIIIVDAGKGLRTISLSWVQKCGVESLLWRRTLRRVRNGGVILANFSSAHLECRFLVEHMVFCEGFGLSPKESRIHVDSKM
jgi:hypothetical protein